MTPTRPTPRRRQRLRNTAEEIWLWMPMALHFAFIIWFTYRMQYTDGLP